MIVAALLEVTRHSSNPIILSSSVCLVTRILNNTLYVMSIIKEATKWDTPEYRYRKRLAEQIYATMISIIKR